MRGLEKKSILWIAALAFVPLSAQAVVVDAVAAAVGNEVILRSEVMGEIAPILADLQGKGLSQSAFERDAQRVYRNALEQAIEREILYREAALAGYEVKDKDIEERLKKIMKQYDSQEAFLQMLERAGQTMSAFRIRLGKELMAVTMGMSKRRDLEKDVTISESDVAQHFQDHQKEFSRPERVRLRRIFLSASNKESERLLARAQLEALREEALLGADFADLAKRHSKGPAAEEGGMVGWIMRDDLVPTLDAAAFALEQGGLSPVLETDYGFSLLLAESKEEAGIPSYEEVRPDIEPLLRAKAAELGYRKWMTGLRQRSQVRVF
jgi:parvulin-like peptidyl-prolyl isomerase